MVYHTTNVARAAKSTIDHEFWDRLRGALKLYMEDASLTQKEMAPRLGLNPTTLSNFLNRQTETVGGLAVALACTIVDLSCNGNKIGRLGDNVEIQRGPASRDGGLILQFDDAFEVRSAAEGPSIILRKPAARDHNLRLSIKKLA